MSSADHVVGGAPTSRDLASSEAVPSATGLRAKVVRGLGWKLASQFVNQGARIAVGLTLARLLTPHEFGLAAMAIAFSGLALVLSDPALGAALVQRRTISEEDRSTVFWTTVAAGLLCTLAGIALAGTIASFFGEPAIRPLVIAESFTFILVALSATQVALKTREMDFRGLELRDMAGTVVGAMVGIAAAVGGLGAWAIIAQSLATVTVATALLWRLSTWRPSFLFSLRSLRECGSFGSKLFASRLLSYLNINGDNLLIGRYLGTRALGTYAVVYNVMLAPVARVASPIQQVLLPAFARLQDDPRRLGRAWLRGTRLSAAVSVPAFLGMMAVAADFVPVVLGERWTEGVPVLQLLCLAGILQGIQMLEWSVLQARGQAGLLLRYMLVSTAANLIGFAVGLHWGIVGVAAGFAVARAIMVPILTLLTCRAVGLSLGDVFRALSGVAQAAALMLVTVATMRYLLIEAGVPTSGRLPLLVAAGVAVYASFLWWRAGDVITELRTLRAERWRAQKPAATLAIR